MHTNKHTILFGSASNAAGETISENITTASGFAADKQGFTQMDVILDVKTLSGTSPTATFSIQEKFSGIFVETAKSTAISTTGKYILCNAALPNSQVANNQGAFPALGTGTDKQVVVTVGGTIGTIATDIYFNFIKQ